MLTEKSTPRSPWAPGTRTLPAGLKDSGVVRCAKWRIRRSSDGRKPHSSELIGIGATVIT